VGDRERVRHGRAPERDRGAGGDARAPARDQLNRISGRIGAGTWLWIGEQVSWCTGVATSGPIRSPIDYSGTEPPPPWYEEVPLARGRRAELRVQVGTLGLGLMLAAAESTLRGGEPVASGALWFAGLGCCALALLIARRSRDRLQL